MQDPKDFAQQFVNDERWLAFDYVGDDDYKVPDVDRDTLAHELLTFILAYGAACAAAERERAAQVVDAAITDLVSRMDPDSEEYYSSVCFHMHQLAAAIRRSP